APSSAPPRTGAAPMAIAAIPGIPPSSRSAILGIDPTVTSRSAFRFSAGGVKLVTGRETAGTSFHGGEVVPKILEAVGAAEKRGEVRGVDEDDVAGTRAGRRHPDQRVKFVVACRGKGVGPVGIDPLTTQNPHRVALRCG